MRRALVLLPLGALLATMAAGQDASRPDPDRFHLFNACRPMWLLAQGRSLSRQAVDYRVLQSTAESRLRAARLYSQDQNA